MATQKPLDFYGKIIAARSNTAENVYISITLSKQSKADGGLNQRNHVQNVMFRLMEFLSALVGLLWQSAACLPASANYKREKRIRSVCVSFLRVLLST